MSAQPVEGPMKETEFIFITANDIHISSINPRSRIDDFKTTILGKIGQMRTACNKLNADGALIAGDLYNYKSPEKNSHNLNQDLIKEFEQFNCPIYMIEGNHDLTGNNLDSLKNQPLGVLFADKTLIQLRHEIIDKDGIKVSLVGIPYEENMDLTQLSIPEKGDCASQICLMHIYAGLKSGMLFKERMYGYDELEKLSPDIFVLGHYHVDQKIYESNGKYFVNIGSLSRGTLIEENISHHPQIGYIKITVKDNKPEYTLQSIKLKIKPASEVFDLIKKKEEEVEREEIQRFVEKLESETVKQAIDTTKTIEEIIDKMGTAKEVHDKVMYFIREASQNKSTTTGTRPVACE
jgi:DNA repair exonuclease SbcCD nuclease subunit